MPVEGRVDDAEYRMRQELGDGTIEGEDFEVSLNIDGAAVIVSFDEGRILYNTGEMVKDAYRTLYEDDEGEGEEDV